MGTTTEPVSAAYGPAGHPATHGLPWACRCGTRWSGTRTAHCSACHRTFTGVGPFDRHRRGGHCLDPADVGLEAIDRGAYTAYGTTGQPA